MPDRPARRSQAPGEMPLDERRREVPEDTTIPNILYKYRSFRGENREFVRQILVDNTVYFSSPSDFNDPLDCRMHMQFSGTDEQWIDYFRDLLSRMKPGLEPKQIATEAYRIVHFVKAHRNPQRLRKMLDDVQRATNALGVYSLSARRDDIAMWSYYADSHRGVCLGFLHRVGPLGPAQPVSYSEQFPVVNFLQDDDQRKMEANLLTKANVWSHEAEWRVIDFTHGCGARQFPPRLLVELILGAKMREDDRSEVLEWARNRNPRPAILQSKVKDGYYGLEIEEVNAAS